MTTTFRITIERDSEAFDPDDDSDDPGTLAHILIELAERMGDCQHIEQTLHDENGLVGRSEIIRSGRDARIHTAAK